MPVTTLTYGTKKVTNPTSGDDWFPAFEANADHADAHVHDGVTGAITPAATATISSGSWTGPTAGLYSQTITLPAGRQYDTTTIQFRLSTGEVVHPTVEKASATSYTVYTPDNSKSFIALYS